MRIFALILAVCLAACDQPEGFDAAPSPNVDLQSGGGQAERPPGDVASRETVLAMQAAFPGTDSLTGIFVGGAVDQQMLPNARTRPLFLAASDGRYFLVTATESDGACHACGAELSVFYLSRLGDTFEVNSAYRAFRTSGGWGYAGEIVPVTFREGLSGFGEAAGYTAQGCTTSGISIYLFGASGPVEVLSAPFSVSTAEYGQNINIDGAIVSPPPAGADFAIRFSGHSGSQYRVLIDETVTWRFNNGQLVPLAGSNPVEFC
jgi:hypothetical protein